MNSGYSVPKGTPDEKSQEESSRKEDQKISKEEEKEKDPVFVPGQKAKVMRTMTSINSSRQTQSFVENLEKEKVRKENSRERKALEARTKERMERIFLRQKEKDHHHKQMLPLISHNQHKKSPIQLNNHLTKKKAGDIKVNGQMGPLLINGRMKITMAITTILMIGKVVGHTL